METELAGFAVRCFGVCVCVCVCVCAGVEVGKGRKHVQVVLSWRQWIDLYIIILLEPMENWWNAGGERWRERGGVGGIDIDTWFIVKAIDPYTRKELE